VKTLRIDHAVIVTMNEKHDVLSDSSVVLQGNKIIAVNSSQQLKEQYPDCDVINGHGRVLLPGLINAHTHVALGLQKGVVMAVPDGLYRIMWPVEKMLTPEDCYIGSLAGGAEALKGGTTTVVDRYFYEEQTARALIELGLRGFIGHTIMSSYGPRTGQQEFDEALAFIQRWKNANELIRPNLAPHATDTVDRDWLVKLREIAFREGVGIQLHVAQTKLELQRIQEKHKMGCIAYLKDIDFLGQDVLAAHCIFIDDHEFEILAETGTHPVYCPMGHALGGNVAQAWKMHEMGVDVLIGTDCVTNNNVMDLVGELRIAGASQKQLTNNPTAMPSYLLLEMVTVNAAKAIGMQGKLGVIAPNYIADLIMLDFRNLSTAPNYSLFDNIVYCCNGRDVETVIVNGEIVVSQHQLVKADETDLVHRVEKTGRELIRRAIESDPELSYLWQR
jgi:5-methylthioadenosine/S-adenosylhomocysteine deaminase